MQIGGRRCCGTEDGAAKPTSVLPRHRRVRRLQHRQPLASSNCRSPTSAGGRPNSCNSPACALAATGSRETATGIAICLPQDVATHHWTATLVVGGAAATNTGAVWRGRSKEVRAPKECRRLCAVVTASVCGFSGSTQFFAEGSRCRAPLHGWQRPCSSGSPTFAGA